MEERRLEVGKQGGLAIVQKGEDETARVQQ